ncbi:MAG: LysE family transporter [Proteobacteria bacterium]|nr:LysE family transporter [Pseudomonadota bacterium]MBU1688497.1 LysE family transporter [Pseudomonadota bacterium]
MFSLLTTGLLLGLSAGLAPGPLMTMVIAESLNHGPRGGIRMALAPAITDLPIILFTLLILARLDHFQLLMAAISLIGALVVAGLGIDSLKARPPDSPMANPPSNALTKGVIINLTSPHPYLFWFSVGGPILLRADKEHGLLAAAGFLATFYALLIGTKIGIALISGRAGKALSGPLIGGIRKVLGLTLILFAALLVRHALSLWGLF